MEDRTHDLSQAVARTGAGVSRPSVAATTQQRAILLAALDVYAECLAWPTARALSVRADCTFPDLCRELKVLARLGLVSWERRVRVLRMPDGVFFEAAAAPENFLSSNTERAFSSVMPRGCVSEADRYEAAP